MAFLNKQERDRLSHIVRVLYDNHLGFVLAKLGLKRYLPFTEHIKSERFKKTELTPKKLLKIFKDLGGSFIKLGQLLSLRPDLIPTEYSEALSELQDNVPSFSGNNAVKVVEDDFNKSIKKVFLDFNKTPIASASIGQVHKAKLKDGTVVVVKVQRPDIKEKFQTDIKLLYRIARMLKKRYSLPNIDPIEIVEEFERYTNNELDYFKEAHNIDFFHKMFDSSKDIRVPEVFWDYCSSRVLTMKYIPGRRLTDLSKFRPEQRRKIMDSILNCEYEQIFQHGFFHADPHPGNFIITRNKKLALLDFGIVGRLDTRMKDALSRLFVSMIKPDLEGMVFSTIDLGVASETTDTDRLRRDLVNHWSRYYGRPLKQIRISEVLTGVIDIMKENDLKAPVDFVLLSKAVVSLEGFAKKMDPEFNFVEQARPFVHKLELRRLNPKEIASDISRRTRALMTFVDSIPRKSSVLLSQLGSADKDLLKIDRDLGLLAGSLDKSSNRLTLGFLAGCVFISSTLLMPYTSAEIFGFPALSFYGYIISLLLMLALMVSILREKHK